MNRTNVSCFLTFLLAFVAAGIQLGCSSEPQRVTVIPETVSDVKTIVVQKASVTEWVEATGTVQAAQTAQLGSQSMGNVIEIRVKEGDRIEQDEVLAVIDDEQARATLEQALAAETIARKEVTAAEADLALAESTLSRYQRLYDEKSVSPQEFDEISSRRQSAKAREEVAAAATAQAAAGVVQARKGLANTQIRAPFSGIVTGKKVDPGSLAVPGMTVLTVEDARSYRLEANVDESEIRSVRIGQTVPVSFDELPVKNLSGKVSQIVPTADPASRSFLVKIDLPPVAKLRSGLFGRARFTRGERSAILAPLTAIVNRGQLQGVYVLDANAIAGLRYVTLGPGANEQVEVLSGLEAGDKLIDAPGDREYAGKKIAGLP